MAKESWYLNESEADDYQIKVIRKNLQSSFIVKGCAGSGKTIIALWRAAELQESGEDFLFIVFTRALKAFIMDGIRELNLDNSKVMYHWEWVKSYGCSSADYIIVDEVQDFDESEVNAFKRAARKHLMLFGDSAQQIYSGLSNKGRLMSMEEIHLLTRIPLEPLVINHRLPKKIARVAERISSSNDALEERCKKEGVNKPRLIKCNSIGQQLDYIRSVIDSEGYEDVGILFPSNDQVEDAYDHYSDTGFNVERKVRSSMNLNFSSTLPKLMTYHSAKGLQFEAVFLPSFELGDNINPSYVAITRTYRDLFILHSEWVDPFQGIVDRSLLEVHDETNFQSNFTSSSGTNPNPNPNTNTNPRNVELDKNFDDMDDDLPF